MRIVLEAPVSVMPQRPRHPEVDQEYTTASKPKNQILATSLERLDDLSVKLGGDLVGIEWPSDPGIGNLNSFEASSDDRGLEARANRLDLGELRHGASVAGSAPLARRAFPG